MVTNRLNQPVQRHRGGTQNIFEEHFGNASYETQSDSKLNAHTSLEFAFQLVH